MACRVITGRVEWQDLEGNVTVNPASALLTVLCHIAYAEDKIHGLCLSMQCNFSLSAKAVVCL